MRYDVLRSFACRDNAEPTRLNAYVSFDADRAEDDPAYRSAQFNFYSLLRDFGYKVIQKTVKWYFDENGRAFGKAKADLPNRSIIFEFELAKSENRNSGFQAINMQLVSPRR